MSIVESSQKYLGNLKSSAIAEGVRRVAPVVIAGTVGYAGADLTTMNLRPDMLPTEAPPVRPQTQTPVGKTPFADYKVIADRNIFNADGKIPPPLSQEDKEDEVSTDEAVLSQLPLTLQGTIVHFDPKKSIATVRLNSKNATYSYIVDEEIEGLARVTQVERRKLTFINLNNRRLEYIEIPEKAAFDFSIQGKPTETASTGPVQNKGNFKFAVKRSEVERLTSNISQILQQARMEPRFGPDNAVNGFCFVSIQGGSIYESLGFRTGDCIESVNGEAVDSPQKAMQIYQNLRSSNNIKLGVERDGRDETFDYDVN